MKTELQQMLTDKINSVQDTEVLLNIMDSLALGIDESLLANSMVWATIKPLDELPLVKSGLFTNKKTRRYADDTKGIKLFFDGNWYISRNFNLKLRPEWITIIEET